MPVIHHQDPPLALPQQAKRVLYVGGAADEVCAIVTQHVGEIDIRYELDTRNAILALRETAFDVVIVDQRDDSLATKLIVPLVSALDYPVKLVVVSQFQNVASYLAVPGVARVLTAPIREGQLLRVLGLQAKTKHYRGPGEEITGTEPEKPATAEPVAVEKPHRRPLLSIVFDPLMALVSTLYKRAAFVLLLALFAAFTFYGVLIAYFLISSSWGAPMTLTQGHEMVNKVERELTELRVALSQVEQRLTQAENDRGDAERALDDAREMVTYTIGTTGKEMEKVKRRLATSKQKLKRMIKARDILANQLSKGGMNDDLDKLYKKRLIDKKSYSSSVLGLLEAEQRLSVFETEIDLIREEAENAVSTLEHLTSLHQGLKEDGQLHAVTAANSDLMLLTKQSFEAKAAVDSASSQLAASTEQIIEMMSGQTVLQKQISALEQSVLARAIDERIDVVFVPYGNQSRFGPGAPLYSCTWTIFWCDASGKVGAPLPGEVNAVHPFFGKPIRGFFVEAKLKNATAATREIIHGGRAPFFF